jgi:hypothetical protein
MTAMLLVASYLPRMGREANGIVTRENCRCDRYYFDVSSHNLFTPAVACEESQNEP